MIFYMTTRTTTLTVTAAIMIFMQAIVSVNTTETVGHHIRPDTEITTATATARETEMKTSTWTKTLYDLSKNPVIAQQSPKILTITQTPSPTPPTSAKLYSMLKSSHIPASMGTVRTIIQRKPRAASTVIAAKTSATDTTTQDVCKSLTGAWGDVDPNIFYICDTKTKKPLQLRCPEGRGFFLGLGYSGCIPYEQWPACVSRGHFEQVIVCDSEHMQQPWESMNPNKFYVCLKETIEPTILNCEPGKGFVHAIVTTTSNGSVGGSAANVSSRDGSNGVGVTSEIVGCANWEKWRNYMQCNDYY